MGYNNLQGSENFLSFPAPEGEFSFKRGRDRRGEFWVWEVTTYSGVGFSAKQCLDFLPFRPASMNWNKSDRYFNKWKCIFHKKKKKKQ